MAQLILVSINSMGPLHLKYALPLLPVCSRLSSKFLNLPAAIQLWKDRRGEAELYCAPCILKQYRQQVNKQ